jgi:dihydropyrimidinase
VLDLVIKNGKIVTESQVFDGEIGIENGKITQISRSVVDSPNKVIDARGKLVLPGLIDGHTHMEMPFMGTMTNDDFYQGTVAAACGGVTTIVDFSVQPKGGTLRETYSTWRKKADPKVCIDYSLHMIIREYNSTIRSEIKDIIDKGVISFKLFMAYKGQLYLDDGSIYSIMEEVKGHGGIVGLHCENGDVIDCLVSKFLSEGKVDPEYHAKSRPPQLEAEAVNRGIRLAEISGSPMYVVHTSTGLGTAEVKANADRGLPVYCETCPHYLVLTDEAYKRPDGNHFIMSPPLRSDEDRAKLWTGLANGSVKTVASDHACFSSKMKAQPDFSRVPNGVPGTEVILPVLYSAGVTKGLLSLNRLVQVSSFNPAKLFGLYPKKGAIAVGSDADLVILDPKKKVRLSKDNLHSNVDYSIYEDVYVTGYPVMTILRGEVVAQDGQLIGKQGRGQFVQGTPFPNGRPEL